MSLKIYLDVCCLKRPYDDQTQPRIHLESEAVLWILKQVDKEMYALVGSEILDLENARNPNVQRRNRVEEIRKRASTRIRLTESLRKRAEMLVGIGFRPADALHLVSAEQAGADAFISCDDRLLSAAARNRDVLKIRVVDPINFSRSSYHEE